MKFSTAIISLSLAGSSHAVVHETSSSNFVTLGNVNYGGVMGLQNRDASSGTRVVFVQDDDDDHPSTGWIYTATTGLIQSQSNPEQCMQADLASAGSMIRVYPCDATEALQRFIFDMSTADSSSIMLEQLSNDDNSPQLCMVFQGTKPHHGKDSIILKQCNTVRSDRIQWTAAAEETDMVSDSPSMSPSMSTPFDDTTGVPRFVSPFNELHGGCFGVESEDMSTGSRVRLQGGASCGRPLTSWHFGSDGLVHSFIGASDSRRLCLQAGRDDEAAASGSEIFTYPCDSTKPNQKFTYSMEEHHESAGSFITLQASSPQLCVVSRGTRASFGRDPLLLKDCDLTQNERLNWIAKDMDELDGSPTESPTSSDDWTLSSDYPSAVPSLEPSDFPTSTPQQPATHEPISAPRKYIFVDAGNDDEDIALISAPTKDMKKKAYQLAVDVDIATSRTSHTMAVFQSQRYPAGSSLLQYSIDGFTPSSLVRVTLGFAEIYSGNCQQGKRVFDVAINQVDLVVGLDVFDVVGCEAAHILSGEFVVDSSGAVIIEFRGVVEKPMVSFVEIEDAVLEVQSDAPSDTPILMETLAPSPVSSDGDYVKEIWIDAGSVNEDTALITWPVNDNKKKILFVPDVAVMGLEVLDFLPKEMFETQRYSKLGDFTYTIPGFEPNSSIFLGLAFAEIYADNCNFGKRVFDVAVASHVIAKDLDVYAVAGCNAVHTISGYSTTDSYGNVVIEFTAGVDKAMVSVIYISVDTRSLN